MAATCLLYEHALLVGQKHLWHPEGPGRVLLVLCDRCLPARNVGPQPKQPTQGVLQDPTARPPVFPKCEGAGAGGR